MKQNPILAAKASGGTSLGAWLTLGNTFLAELMGKLGFDWIVLDLQHGTINWDTAGAAIQAIELAGTSAIVRVPWNDPPLIMRALDLGAAGVVVPMVSTVDDARRASEAARYPPHGIRSFGPSRGYYSTNAQRTEPACIAMIETRLAVDNLAAIVSTPGIDATFMGPVDLALDMGLPLSMSMDEKVLRAADEMVAACQKSGVLPGSASLGLKNAEELIRRGVRLLTLGADVSYIQRAAQQDVEFIKALRSTH